ncbi:hypothetical protein BDGGKGIB_01930 [Nodularia sphaerocarpa UHCC 0038]|nr:hypothetical protein BDGGKGIB_01930 [Nodularia sphaerocarpa UHCC 0038]
MHLNELHHSPLLAPPEIQAQRGEEKDKLLIWEGVWGWGSYISLNREPLYKFSPQ